MENIAAISTPPGRGGVAIVRISGDDPLKIVGKMFEPTAGKPPEHGYMRAGRIVCDGFSDFGYVVYFKAPRSFTGEDVVEIHCHGGEQIALGVLKKAVSLGARFAEAGEFSRRAFLNGKLTLSSAEGMIDMINAQSGALLRAGSMQYFGKLNSEVAALQARLKDVLAELAVNIDYPEEDADGLDFGKISRDICSLSDECARLAGTYGTGRKIKSGVSVAICGAPNVGKSSLLNAIVGYDRAIVSSKAGTTRDVVEEAREIDGVLFRFYDTAGIRERAGEIESAGIDRAKTAAKSADIVLSVTDDGVYCAPETSGEVIKVFNKCDKTAPSGEYDVKISALTGEGMDGLFAALKSKGVGELASDKAYILEERHYCALRRAADSLSDAAASIDGGATPELIYIDLKEAWTQFGEITGETASEEIINTVFAKFCVGK